MKDSMSLKDMESYRGRLEVPDDFDSFWSKEIKKIEAKPFKLIKRNFGDNIKNVVFYDLFFKGTDNGIVHAKCIFPAHEKNIPVRVVLVKSF